MNLPLSKRNITAIVILIVIIAGIFTFAIWRNNSKKIPVAVKMESISPQKTIIGLSVEKRAIEAYTFSPMPGGTSQKKIVFVGGIHGGYEWNSVLLAYKLIDYLSANPQIIPKNLSIIIIPTLNPDGVYKVIGKEGAFTAMDVPNDFEQTKAGRFNADKVDLNRNFACHWTATSTWQGKVVSAGTAVFSEPEAKAFQDFVLKNNLSAVIFWHSQSNGVYASQCKNGILPGTLDLMNLYAKASGYPPQKSFDSYAISGAADDWLASINIPAVSVELKTHESLEWNQNLAGIKAVLDFYGKN